MSTESAQRIEDEAARWLARRDSGNWSACDEHSFERWMNESMAHCVAYWRLQDAWEEALRLKALGAGIQSEDPPPPGQWNLSPYFTQRTQFNDPKRRPLSHLLGAMAASMALLVAAGVAGYWWFSAPSFRTPVGGLASLPIEDGSKVTLNTDSSIKVAISETERRIDLTHGEAFFEVAKDPARPFVVRAGDKRVIAIGTRFSVRRDIGDSRNDVEVIVTEGTVRIESAGGKSAEVLAQPLTAGSVARTTGDKLVVHHKDMREAEESLSWRSGVLVFRNTTLAAAVAEFNRYNARKIVIDDSAAAALTIAGSFRSTSVDSFVEIIEKGYPVRVDARGDDFIISAER
jgi:transmembrane sensor